MANVVAIVGRPNVGKSTLFNRLTESRKAIVDDVSGVTRDRHYGKVIWGHQEFSVIDTGGYIVNSDDFFEKEIRHQVELAIEEANVIIFLVEVDSGITDMDNIIAQLLRKSGKKVVLVVNKVDNNKKREDAFEFYSLGLGDYHCIASNSGSGTGDMLDAIADHFDTYEPEVEIDLPKFAFVGRPNVGKSSFANVLLGTDRNIVTPVAGTTRDTVNSYYKGYGFEFMLLDTAGVRKKSRVHEDIEFYSVMRAIRTIEDSDVCFLIIDAELGFEGQDQKIFHLIESNKKGLVIIVNKWDLIEDKKTQTMKQYTEKVLEKIAPFKDVPIIFTSVLNKQRIHKALETGVAVYKNRERRIPTSKLNEWLLPVVQNNPPPSNKGKYVKIKYITQLPTKTPSFAFFCNLPQYVKDPYKRFLENKLREAYDFTGVPIQIYMRKK
jgi:GTP-binding protein